jgi:3-hydroxybutyryl-CoA dehydrogenase
MKIGVVGAGTMGSGIAQVFAQAGFQVRLYDPAQGAIDRARAAMTKSLGKFVEKGVVTADDMQAALARVHPALSLEAFAETDYVIEAASEQLDIKRVIFQTLDAVVGESAILASNTSSIPIGTLAAATRRPDRVLGMHFMNPVPLMPLVEVIRGRSTSDGSMRTAIDLCVRLGKTAVESADSPGFIANRVLMPMINEAMYAAMEHVGTPEAIDTVMKLGMSHPMGPLALADLIGLDVCLAIMNVLHEGFGDAKYRPCPLLVEMVDAGRLGRKSGRGFYDYSTRS